MDILLESISRFGYKEDSNIWRDCWLPRGSTAIHHRASHLCQGKQSQFVCMQFARLLTRNNKHRGSSAKRLQRKISHLINLVRRVLLASQIVSCALFSSRNASKQKQRRRLVNLFSLITKTKVKSNPLAMVFFDFKCYTNCFECFLLMNDLLVTINHNEIHQWLFPRTSFFFEHLPLSLSTPRINYQEF